jgi:hypothetical protein
MAKYHKKTKSSFHGLQNLNLSFLLSLKYNILRSENLHTYRIQHYLRHNIFSIFLETSKFKISKVQNLATMELELQMAVLGEINPYIGPQKRLMLRSALIAHYDMSLSKPEFFSFFFFCLSLSWLKHS